MATANGDAKVDADIEKCAVCSTPCKTFCSACKKVYYCSTDHQKVHRKTHKNDCFPAVLITDEIQGRHFVTTKDLKPGDLIFKDNAVVCGPSGAETFFHIICLGCYNVVKTHYHCSKCKWPVCSVKCEKVKHHADFECKIFEREKIVPYFTIPGEYDFIKFLRSLLLKEIDPKKWSRLSSLASHSEVRSKCQQAVIATNVAFKFINSVCKLEQFDYATVHHIVGVWSVNSFGANPPQGQCPTGSLASFMFPRTCLASHSCVANTHGIFLESIRDSVPSYSMELLASLPIKSGAAIHTTYADVGEGTLERRQILLDNYYFSCSCPRCKDPTEFGTYFSAFKCSVCPNGYLLMKDPLDFETIWNCDKCSATSSYDKLCLLIFKIKNDLHNLDTDINSNIAFLEKILWKNQDVTVHKNHWLMMEVEFELAQRLLIVCRKKTAKTVDSSALKRLIDLCEHCLTIANTIRPGHNSYRGKLLYCLCQGKFQSIMRTTTGGGDFLLQRENLLPVKDLAEEGLEILSREPEGSEDKRIANTLKQDLVQINTMLTLLNTQFKSAN